MNIGAASHSQQTAAAAAALGSQNPSRQNIGPLAADSTPPAASTRPALDHSGATQPTSDLPQTLIVVTRDLKGNQISSPSPTSTVSLTANTNNINHDSSTLSPVADQHQHGTFKKNLKTEYKSNFTPFDQYVYNENTDSFVKQQHCKLSPAHSGNQLNLSGSSNDLNSPDARSAVDPSPVLNVEAFGPLSNGNPADHSSEPWYKEVVRRNEKAHEYRYKSEVGHSSPLSKLIASDEDSLVRRSPCGNDPLIEAQIRDRQEEILRGQTSGSAPSASAKPAFKFSPNDYSKRDHMISHMANNNNFNLPKQAEIGSAMPAGSTTAASRQRVAASAHSRPATRSTAQSRARSQSSRRPLAATGGALATSKTQPESKSNQTTPTKKLSSTTGRSPATTATTRTAIGTTTRRPTTGVAASATGAPSTRTATGSTLLARQRPPSASIRTTSRVANGTVESARQVASSTTRPSPSARVAPKARLSSKASPAAGTASSPIKRPTTAAVGSTRTPPTSATKSARPIAGNRSSATSSVSASRPKVSPPTSKSSSGAQTPTTSQVKSIKTPKALASAQEKATAAALAAGSAAAVAAIATAARVEVQPEPSNQLLANDSEQLANVSDGNETLTATGQNLAGELSRFDEFAGSPAGRQSDAVNNFLPEQTFGTADTNMLFTTAIGETGNMLADELAQAERAANESANNNQSAGEQLRSHGGENDQPAVELPTLETAAKVDLFAVASGDQAATRDSQAVMTSSTRSDDSAGELFNGLKGGLVSAEDRFSSSERDASLEDPRGADQQPAGGLFGVDRLHQQQQQEQTQGDNYDEEPYSIMPTTFDVVNKHSQPGGSDDTAKVNTGTAGDAQKEDSRGQVESEQIKLIEDKVETPLRNEYVETVNSSNQNLDQATTNSNDTRSDSEGDRQLLDLAEQQSDLKDKLLGDRRSPSVDSSSSSSPSPSPSSRNKDEPVGRNDGDQTVDIGELVDKIQVLEKSDEADDEADKLDSSASSSTNKSWDKMYQVQSDHKEALKDDAAADEGNGKLGEKEALVGVGDNQANLLEDWPRQHQHQQEQVCQNDEDETQKFRQVFDEHRPDEELNRLVDEKQEKPEQVGGQSIDSNANDDDKKLEFDDNVDLLENRKVSSDDERLDSGEFSKRTASIEEEKYTREKSLDRALVSDDQRRGSGVPGATSGANDKLELTDVAFDEKVDASSTVLSSAIGDSEKITTPQGGQTQLVDLTRDDSASGHDAADQGATPAELQGRDRNEPADDGQPLEQLARDNGPVVDSSLLVESTRQQENHNKKSVSSSGSGCDDDDDDGGTGPDESRASELLMNVADLVDFEARTKQELARRAELARQQSGSMASPAGGEMLLSPDQLISALADDGPTTTGAPAGKLEPGAAIDFGGTVGGAEHRALGGSVGIDSRATATTSDERPQEPLETGLEPQVTSLSAARTGEENKSAGGSGGQRHSSLVRENEIGLEDKPATRSSGSSGDSDSSSGAANHGDRQTGAFEPRTEHLSNYDELDNDEHLKMSNHLTNSDDDELIREPRSSIDLDETLLSATMASANNNNNNSDLVQSESTTNFGLVPSDLSSPRYNEGAGLSNLIAAQDEHDDDNDDQIRFEAGGAVASEPAAVAPASAASASASATAALGANCEGSSLAAPPVATATTTSTMPDELPPATAAAFIRAPKLAHNEADSDSDDELLDLNDPSQADRITDVAATMSPSSSVASELLRMTNKVSYSTSLDNEASPTSGSPVRLSDNNNDANLSSNERRRPSESDSKPAAEQLVLSRS